MTAIRARPMAVLPEEFSMMVSPVARRPSASALSTMWRAMRSLTLPMGFMNSILAKTSQSRSGDRAVQPDQRRPADGVRNAFVHS